MIKSKYINQDYIFIVLFFVSGFFSNGFLHKESLSIFLIAGFAWLIYRKVNITDFVALIYILFVFISFIFSDFPDYSRFAFEIFSVFIIFYFKSVSSDKDTVKFFKVAVYLSGFAVFTDMILKKYFDIGILFTSKNQNYQAFFYVLIYGFIMEDMKKKISVIYVILIWLAVFMSGSRSALVAISIMSFLRFYNLRDEFSKYIIITVFISLIYISFNYEKVFKLNDPNAYKRIDIYMTSLRAILSRPLSGWGPGSFEYVFEIFKFSSYDGRCFYNHSAVHAHSHFLNLTVECGIFCGIIMLIIILNSLYRKGLFLYSLSGLFIFFIIDSIYYNPFINLIFWILVGFSYKDLWNIKVGNHYLAAGVITGFIIYVLNKPFDCRIYYCVYSYIFTTNPFRSAALSEYALTYSPRNAIFYYIIGSFYYEINLYERAEIFLTKAVELEPEFIAALNKISDIYLKQKRYHQYNEIQEKLKYAGEKKKIKYNFYERFISFSEENKYNFLKKVPQ